MTTVRFVFCCAAAGLALAACTPLTESADRAAGASKRAMYDTKKSWSDLFSYHPKSNTAQLPQTRYCYAMQTDTVCYDSPQSGMTAVLSGYQDGNNISAYQPGGGSLGVSGGEATATFQTEEVHTAPPQKVVLEGGQVVAQPSTYSDAVTVTDSGNSAYEQNAAIANQIAAQKASR